MKKACLLLPLMFCIPTLQSCNTAQVQPKSALQFEPLLRIQNSDSTARGFYQMGRYYQGQRRYEQAADAYRKALKIYANYIEARSALGTVYSAQGKYEAAITEFTSILNTTPQLAYIYNNLGFTYYLQKNYADAATAFEKAIALEPGNKRAINNLGLAYRELGETEKSRSMLARAAKPSQQITAAATPSISQSTSQAAVDNAPPKSTSANIERQAQTATQSISVAAHTGSVALPLTDVHSATTLATAMPALPSAVDMSSMLPGQDNAQHQRNTTATPLAENRKPLSLVETSTRSQSNVFRLEISNGNGIQRLARKVADILAHKGLPTPRLTNLKPYRQRQTLIQYRNGFRNEALRLSNQMRNPPLLVNSKTLPKNADVRLVLGKDATHRLAMFGPGMSALSMVDVDAGLKR